MASPRMDFSFRLIDVCDRIEERKREERGTMQTFSIINKNPISQRNKIVVSIIKTRNIHRRLAPQIYRGDPSETLFIEPEQLQFVKAGRKKHKETSYRPVHLSKRNKLPE